MNSVHASKNGKTSGKSKGIKSKAGQTHYADTHLVNGSATEGQQNGHANGESILPADPKLSTEPHLNGCVTNGTVPDAICGGIADLNGVDNLQHISDQLNSALKLNSLLDANASNEEDKSTWSQSPRSNEGDSISNCASNEKETEAGATAAIASSATTADLLGLRDGESLIRTGGPEGEEVEICGYKDESDLPGIIALITKDLSEPYSIYTYRYFIHNWPQLCFKARLRCSPDTFIGAIVCKLDVHRVARRGYIAMLAVHSTYRRHKIGRTLVKYAIASMIQQGCDEVVLETEVTNKAAMRLYEQFGFVRDKRLHRYYLNGVDAFRLKLWLT